MLSDISCPRCGHFFGCSEKLENFGNHLIGGGPAGLSLCGQREGDVTVIQEELRRLDGLIHQLNQNRARLLHKVNQMQAATRRLPPEVLSTIFQFARPPIDFDARRTPSEFLADPDLWRETREAEDDFQLVLSAVSCHWRQVVWATPQLWTTISVEVCQTGGKSNLSLLSLYFENS